jgi:hypothetical protein
MRQERPVPVSAAFDLPHCDAPSRRPHPAQQRLEANAVFVGRPQLHAGLREGGGDLPQQGADVFLKVSCCAASASAWRGRGTCKLCLRRTR